MKGHKVFAVGYENGDIKLFSVDNSQYVWESQLKSGICAIEFDKECLRVSTLVGAHTINLESGKVTDIVVNYREEDNSVIVSLLKLFII